MTPAELRALADDVEKLDGPSREMDVRVEVALGAKMAATSFSSVAVSVPDPNTPGWYEFRDARPYTASLDVAASLVPNENGEWCIRSECNTSRWLAYVARWEPRPFIISEVRAATEPLARTACALRARAALLEAGATDAAGPEAA